MMSGIKLDALEARKISPILNQTRHLEEAVSFRVMLHGILNERKVDSGKTVGGISQCYSALILFCSALYCSHCKFSILSVIGMRRRTCELH